MNDEDRDRRIRELEEALKPFALLGQAHKRTFRGRIHVDPVYSIQTLEGGVEISVADIHRACNVFFQFTPDKD